MAHTTTLSRHITLLLAALLFTTGASADPITDLQVERDGAGDLEITWTLPSDINDMEAEGILLQWGDNLSYIGDESSARHRLKRDDNQLVIRGDEFDRETTYYFFATPYRRGGYNDRDTIFLDCGSALRWKEERGGTYETKDISINCATPTAEEDDDDNISTARTEGTSSKFGRILARTYETDMMLRWKRPQVSSAQVDNIQIVVSRNSDMTDPIAIFQTDPSESSARVSGAMAGTTYYVQGSFLKDNRQFATSEIFEATTQEAYTDEQSRKFILHSRNGIINLSADVTVDLAESQTGFSTGASTTPTTVVAAPTNGSTSNGVTQPVFTPSTVTPVPTSMTTATPQMNAGDLDQMSKTELEAELRKTRTYLRALLNQLRQLDRA